MNKLKDILYKAGSISIKGSTELLIEGITFDSRDVKKNYLFIAVRGEVVDGHKFIAQAILKGAIAVVCENIPEKTIPNITYIAVENSQYALGHIASNYNDNPTEKIKLIGITGTNGKTTTATLLYNLFSELGYKCGLISTIRIIIAGEEIETTHTTPDAIKLNEIFHLMQGRNISHCFMEVSSHAVVQHRITGLHFTGGVFSNITHDHLDYHKTFAEYLHAKKTFFDNLPKDAFALSNVDDKNGEIILQNTKAKKHYYGLKKMAEFKCKIIESHFSGINLNINGDDVWLKLIGKFNAYNALATYATAILLGENKIDILRILSNLDPIEGRFQHFKNNKNITAIVDYAHTPDALLNVLSTINSLRTLNENLITVVGCGGNRDKDKRPQMAKIAGQLSNKLILTSDNPRFEEAETIIEEMMVGIDVSLKKKTIKITDRRQAIYTACLMANEGDIILVAGKGHEKYQDIKGVKSPFDDIEILKEFLT